MPASTSSAAAISFKDFLDPLKGITEVREITLRERMGARLVISSSVIPSAKYSWVGSPERFASGRTASDPMWGRGPPPEASPSERRFWMSAVRIARITASTRIVTAPAVIPQTRHVPWRDVLRMAEGSIASTAASTSHAYRYRPYGSFARHRALISQTPDGPRAPQGVGAKS